MYRLGLRIDHGPCAVGIYFPLRLKTFANGGGVLQTRLRPLKAGGGQYMPTRDRRLVCKHRSAPASGTVAFGKAVRRNA